LYGKFGAICITFHPLSEKIRLFMAFDDDFADISVAMPIVQAKGMKFPPTFSWDRVNGTDCSDYARAKINACRYAVENNLGRRSSDCADNVMIPGRRKDRGCVAFDISFSAKGENTKESIVRFYVSVHSGDGEIEDERCAMGAEEALRKYVESLLPLNSVFEYSLISPD